MTPSEILSSPAAIPHPFIPGLQFDPSSMSMAALQTASPIPADLLLPQAVVTICSVVPWPLESQAYPHGCGAKRYRIPAPRDWRTSFSLLRLTNTYTTLMNVLQAQEASEYPGSYHQPIFAIDPTNVSQGYAHDLIKEWAGDHPGNIAGRLGLGVILGTKPWAKDNEPTEKELSSLRQIQHNFFMGLVRQADINWQSGNPQLRQRIIQEHRRALEFSGEPVDSHEWYIPVGVHVGFAECPACGGKFRNMAFKCAACHEDLASYYMERGYQYDAKELPGIAREIAYRVKLGAAKNDKGDIVKGEREKQKPIVVEEVQK